MHCKLEPEGPPDGRKGPSCSSWQTLGTQWEFSLELQVNPQALNSQPRIHAHAGAEETWQGKVSCVAPGGEFSRVSMGSPGELVTGRALQHLSVPLLWFYSKHGCCQQQQMASARFLGVPKVGGCREAQRVTPGPCSNAANRSWCDEDRCPPAVLRGSGTAVPWCACHDAYSFLVARLPRGTGGGFVPTTRTFCETFAALGCSTEWLRSSPFGG